MSIKGIQLFIQMFIFNMLKHHICYGSHLEQDLYVLTNNVRLEHVHNVMMTSSKIACCVECGSDVNCLSVNYRKSTGKCELSPLPWAAVGTNSVVDSEWTTMSKYNEWFLIFLGVAGNGVDIYDAWMYGIGVTTDDVSCMQRNFTACSGLHYRNIAVNSWYNLNIKQVKYSLYKDSHVVAYVIFDGEGHSIDSWFTSGGIIASSWTDIKTQTFNVFSVEGMTPARRFYINLNYGGCHVDRDYTVIVTSHAFDCNYDDQDSYPQFLYSNTSSYTVQMQGFDKADAITIHIKT